MSGKFALVFGNTQYADPALAQLSAPGKDAQDLARVLKASEICGFDEVSVLLNERSSSAIEAIDAFFDSRKPDDLLVLYFSGHGIRDELGSLYLAFSNTARTRLRSTALKAEYIREAMDESRSKRQVLILDCCNSGAFPSGTKAELGGAMGLTNALQGYGRYVLTASDATQFAWEGDRVIGETSNSLFTHFLIKGLEGDADRDGDGTISVDDLYDYSFEQIAALTPKQTPTKSASRQEGEIVLRRITRLEDIKPVSLPEDLVEAIEDQRTFVREGAVQQLGKLLNGKNLGLARSAREALERLCEQDDSLRVRKAAADVLAPVRAAEQQPEQVAAAKAEADEAPVTQPNLERAAEKPVRSGEIRAEIREMELAHEQFGQHALSSLGKLLKRSPARQKGQEHVAAPKQAEQQPLKRPIVYGEQSLAESVGAGMPGMNVAANTLPGDQIRGAEFRIRNLLLPGLLIGLGYAASAILWPLFRPEIQVGYTVFGALSGLIIAIVLYSQRLVKQWTSVLFVTVVWGLIGGISAAILIATNYSADSLTMGVAAGLLEGLILGFALYRDKALSRRSHILWIILLWMITELAIGGAIQSTDGVSLDDSVHSLIHVVVLLVFGVGTGFAMLMLTPILNPESGISQRSGEPALAGQKSSALPRWPSTLWAVVGCALAGSVLAPAAEWSSDPGRRQAVIVLGSSGLCIGFFIALMLLAERRLIRGRSLLATAFGWAGAWAVLAVIAASSWYTIGTAGVWILFILTWALGGLVTGAVLRDEHALPSWGSVALVTLVCAIGGVIVALIMGVLASGGISSGDAVLPFAGAGVLAGAVVGAGMIWSLRRAWVKSNQR